LGTKVNARITSPPVRRPTTTAQESGAMGDEGKAVGCVPPTALLSEARSRVSSQGKPRAVLGRCASRPLCSFQIKPILFSRALRFGDITFFFLRCTATHDPSLYLPSRCCIGTRQCPSRRLNFNTAAKPRSQAKSRQFQTKPILSKRFFRSANNSSWR
jgi:hypothetical protein